MKLKCSLKLNTLDVSSLKLPNIDLVVPEETKPQNEKIKVLQKTKKHSVSPGTEELF